MVTHDAGGLGASPDGHGFGGGEVCGEAGLGDGVFLRGFCGDIGLLVGLGFGFVSAHEALGDVAALEHQLAVVGGMELADEGFDVDAALEVGVVQAGVGVLDGGGGDVCEDGTEVFGEATEAAEGEFEPGDGVVEFVLGLGDVGSGEEGVYAVQEFVDGDLVDAGGAGLVVEAEGAVFVGFIGLEGCGNGIGFRCWEAGDPGAGSGPSGFAFDASVHIGAYEP